MSKWLSVCIFLLLAIACTVDVEPTEIVTPAGFVTPAGRADFVTPVTTATPAEIATTEALAGEEGANASASLVREGDGPRAFDTRAWSHASIH
jgi:hypothetical protein